jgi:hypothetical protein
VLTSCIIPQTTNCGLSCRMGRRFDAMDHLNILRVSKTILEKSSYSRIKPNLIQTSDITLFFYAFALPTNIEHPMNSPR